MKKLTTLTADELMAEAKHLGAPFELVQQVAKTGKLPVPNFAAGGVAIPADAALMMKLGAEAVFVGSGIFEVGDPHNAKSQRRDQTRMAKAIVQAVANWNRPDVLKDISTGLPAAMRGISLETLSEDQLLAKRGW
jgi:pyridoxal 5'-phosphate synthase pdxS subunit